MKWTFIALIASLILTVSCSDSKHERLLGESIGAQSEVLLVADRAILQSDVADTLDEVLCGPTPGLNQNEPFFRLIHLAKEDYVRKYTAMHSILIVTIGNQPATQPSSNQEPTIGVAYDERAKPQTIVQVTAPSLEALRTFLPTHKQTIRDLLVDGQLNTMARQLKRRHSKVVADDLSRLYGYTISVPEEIKFDKKGKDFLWASDKRDEKNQNFVFYTYPYTGDSLLTETCFAHHRDSVMKANIPGSTPSQWMSTVWEGDEPIIKNRLRRIDGRVVCEVRGLWEMHDGAMGGPFVSLAQVDTAKGRMVVVEGFIFSPSTNKRDLIRTMEASLRTLVHTKQ